jgi:hypothetical protein
MRTGLTILTLACVTAGPAAAGGFVIPEQKPAHFDAYASPVIAHPWVDERPEPRLKETPLGDLIATRIGLVNGSAELFRYRVEDAPSEKTVLDGMIDGGGIKLKLSW